MSSRSILHLSLTCYPFAEEGKEEREKKKEEGERKAL